MKPLSENEQKILVMIANNPFISQSKLAEELGFSRSAVAGHISNLMKKGRIVGRAYVLAEEQRITCLGGANLDRKAETLHPLQYKTSNPVRVQESFGGVARNIAENLGRLGASVSLITGIGKDKEGESVLEHARQQGIDVSQSFTLSEEKTGTYMAVLDSDGEMVLALADMAIYDRITVPMIREKWIHIASSAWVVVDTNFPAEVLTYIVSRCHEEKVALCVVPTSVPKVEKLPDDLRGIQLLIGNRDEIAALTGCTMQNQELVRAACQQVLDRGVENVILTMGAEGVFFIGADGEAGWITPKVEQPVDVTGAGDAFAAGVLFVLNQHQDLRLACEVGMVMAALTLQTKKSVHPSLTLSLVEKKLGKSIERGER